MSAATLAPNPRLLAALAHAQRGHPVFPVYWPKDGACACGEPDCSSPAKHPIGELAPNGVKNATTSAAMIRAAWQHSPLANPGMATGAASGITVLDIDGDKGGYDTLAQLEAEHGPLPHTQRVRTASGEHVYMKFPGVHLKNTSGKLGPGLDIRCCNGYVVAVGSVHRTGCVYDWVDGCRPNEAAIAEWPAWLTDRLTEKPRPAPTRRHLDVGANRYAAAALEREVATLTASANGTRNVQLNTAAFSLGQLVGGGELDRGDVESSLLNAAVSVGLGEREAERTIQSGLEAGIRLPRTAPESPVPLRDKGRQSLTHGGVASLGGSGALSHGIVRLADVQPERVQWLWQARIPLGKLTLLDGDPGLGKSLMTLDITARATTGRPMPDGGAADLAGPTDVVLLTAEDGLGDTVRPRLEAAGADLNRVHALTWVADGDEKRMPTLADVDALEEVICRTGARVAIVDPLMAFLPGEVNSYRDQDVRRLLAPLARLAERTGAAIIVVRHLNKAIGNNPIYRGGGSIGIIGAVRSALLVAKDPDDPDGRRRILASTKCNLAQEPSALAYRLESIVDAPVPRVTWEGATGHTAATLLAPVSDEADRSAGQEASDVLREILTAGPVLAVDVRKAARDAGVADRTLDRAKAALRVKATRQGGLGATGQWYWSLPLSAPNSPKNATTPYIENPASLANSGVLSGVCRLCETRGLMPHELNRGTCSVCENKAAGTW